MNHLNAGVPMHVNAILGRLHRGHAMESNAARILNASLVQEENDEDSKACQPEEVSGNDW
ncbi:hypothetical protein AMJ85_07000 [candidate division BRC1 bacterium SM23_51]|nr:MAG: hypothetical protein AMJ85_07000 [candidate division BRC1 bacterium SM23_51]